MTDKKRYFELCDMMATNLADATQAAVTALMREDPRLVIENVVILFKAGTGGTEKVIGAFGKPGCGCPVCTGAYINAIETLWGDNVEVVDGIRSPSSAVH